MHEYSTFKTSLNLFQNSHGPTQDTKDDGIHPACNYLNPNISLGKTVCVWSPV